jgi:heme-degrading monooxygenase HmoA
MTNKEIMFIVLYRWRIKPESEEQFIQAWSEVTEYYRKNHDSLGSRLHRGSDGFFYGYAQWKSAEDRQKAFEIPANLAARARMREAIAENFPETVLEKLADYLILPETQ